LQPGEAVVAEKIDRISRLLLADADNDPVFGGELRCW
jgi:hypothetical protein